MTTKAEARAECTRQYAYLVGLRDGAHMTPGSPELLRLIRSTEAAIEAARTVADA